ncbi:NADP-dependent malic enzyme [Diorhabda carinulata]|uniref:NADP-dependent malic enzyme n=1 Tax=Diorhabda carinulata TaxID=1163345 RepID=UPI0025A24034|nr:NADP-dependent malic enzyme [Diorhabda carinulata]
MLSTIPKTLTSSARAARNQLFQTLKILTIADDQQRRNITGDIISPGQVLGIDHLRDPRLNKGLGFTLEERQALGIHGLQPARFKTQEEQLELCRISIERYQEDLNKYIYLTELQDRNEKLFFRLLSENIESLMPIVYTPTVGLACQKFGLIYRRPRGLFITINDIGHVFDVLKNWPEPNVKAIVVTDGERILGLGDLGACGMGIPVGKLALYTALAGIKPHECLPIVLDVGTNNQNLLEDPLYVGLRQKRTTGKLYDDFVDEFMEAVVQRYGQNTLIQFEDFGNHNAFRFLNAYREQYCTFNDDIQGTASVAVSGLLASKRLTNKKLSDNKFLFLGAGEAAIGIADLTVKALENEGLSTEEARGRIWMVDIDGLLALDRPEGNLDGHKKLYAKKHEPIKDFAAIVNEIKPSILIGASAVSGAFTPEILKNMSTFNERPIIFALSNPTSKAECTAEQAYTHTEGRAIFASGSPFGKVHFGDKLFQPGQGNNAYIFPGVALGVLLAGIHHINEQIFLIASETVASNVSDEDLKRGSLYPPLSSIKECSMQIACQILEYAYKERIASVYPKPKDMRKYVESHQYNHNYEPSLPQTWPWPNPPYIKTRPLEPTKLKA